MAPRVHDVSIERRGKRRSHAQIYDVAARRSVPVSKPASKRERPKSRPSPGIKLKRHSRHVSLSRVAAANRAAPASPKLSPASAPLLDRVALDAALDGGADGRGDAAARAARMREMRDARRRLIFHASRRDFPSERDRQARLAEIDEMYADGMRFLEASPKTERSWSDSPRAERSWSDSPPASPLSVLVPRSVPTTPPSTSGTVDVLLATKKARMNALMRHYAAEQREEDADVLETIASLRREIERIRSRVEVGVVGLSTPGSPARRRSVALVEEGEKSPGDVLDAAVAGVVEAVSPSTPQSPSRPPSFTVVGGNLGLLELTCAAFAAATTNEPDSLEMNSLDDAWLESLTADASTVVVFCLDASNCKLEDLSEIVVAAGSYDATAARCWMAVFEEDAEVFESPSTLQALFKHAVCRRLDTEDEASSLRFALLAKLLDAFGERIVFVGRDGSLSVDPAEMIARSVFVPGVPSRASDRAVAKGRQIVRDVISSSEDEAFMEELRAEMIASAGGAALAENFEEEDEGADWSEALSEFVKELLVEAVARGHLDDAFEHDLRAASKSTQRGRSSSLAAGESKTSAKTAPLPDSLLDEATVRKYTLADATDEERESGAAHLRCALAAVNEILVATYPRAFDVRPASPWTSDLNSFVVENRPLPRDAAELASVVLKTLCANDFEETGPKLEREGDEGVRLAPDRLWSKTRDQRALRVLNEDVLLAEKRFTDYRAENSAVAFQVADGDFGRFDRRRGGRAKQDRIRSVIMFAMP